MEQKNIDNILGFIKEATSIRFDGERYTISENEASIAQKYSIPTEQYGTTYRLKLKDYLAKENIKYAQNLYSEIKNKDISSDILLFEGSGVLIKYFAESNVFQSYGEYHLDYLIRFQNIIAYWNLFNCLKSKEFCDYFNDANNEIVVYTSINGVYKITYPTIPSASTEDITSAIKEFIQLSESIELRPFLKNAIFSSSDRTGLISINWVIANIKAVISVAKRDFELVAKQFDFEKFRDLLYKEKDKYFTNIREIINKIFSQAVGIPISISATVFATYKIDDDIIMLAIVLLAFLVYTCFYIKLQCTYKNDIKEVESEFISHFEIIKTKSGLPKEIVESEKKKIDNKIRNSNATINWLIGTVLFMGLLVFWYILYQIAKSEIMCLLKSFLLTATKAII